MITISPGEEKEFQRLVSSVSGLCAFCEEIHLFSWDFSLLYHCRHNCTKLPEQISSLGLDQKACVWGEEVEFWWSGRCAWRPLAYAELCPELALSYPSFCFAACSAACPTLRIVLGILIMLALRTPASTSWAAVITAAGAPGNVCVKGSPSQSRKGRHDFYQFTVSPGSSLAVGTVSQGASPQS